jgi:hypothetical protein
MLEEIDRFEAADSDGYSYTVVILQNFIKTRTRSGVSRHPGLKEARTIDGWALNTSDGETFEIVDTGTTIRKID